MIVDLTERCSLFSGISKDDLETLLDCIGARRCTFEKDEYIFRVGKPALHVGVMLQGGAYITQEDVWGNRTILAHIRPGEIFGEAFSCAKAEQLPVSILTTEASEVMLLDYQRLIGVCPTTCVFHSQLITNMLGILARRNILLTRKMEHMSQRTTREKLLSFLSSQAVQAQCNEITVPYNRQELADYLCVDRSALSRELALMKKEGILDYSKNHFVLLDVAALS